MLLLKRISQVAFRASGGYAIVHLLYANPIFDTNYQESVRRQAKRQQSKWGRQPPYQFPTLSEDLASWFSRSTLAPPLFLLLVSMGAGFSGLIGAAAALALDGENGRQRYAELKGYRV